ADVLAPGLPAGGGRRGGQRESKDRAAVRRVGDTDRAAVLLCHLPDDRQAEAAALLSARVGTAEEAIEYVGKILLRDALAVVADANAGAANLDLDPAAGRRVAGGIVEQVVDGASQAFGDSVHDHGLEAGVEGDVGSVAPRPRHRLADDPIEPCVLGRVRGK